MNGWLIGSAFGNREFFKGDWTLRAAAALAGIYGNNEVEALYPLLAADSDGNKPDCGRKRYTLTFAKGQLPPANAFWSVTMYDAKTRLLVDNPIDRYVLGDRDKLVSNADGSLDIYIQRDSPGPDKESNWLPVSTGPFTLLMRLYSPKDDVLSGAWTPPPVNRR